jgi:hypothetical protein
MLQRKKSTSNQSARDTADLSEVYGLMRRATMICSSPSIRPRRRASSEAINISPNDRRCW